MAGTSDDERRFGHWERIRDRGALRFVITFGLIWGTLLFIATSAVRLVWGFFSEGDPLEFARDPFNILTGIAMFAAAGIVWSAIVWFSSERAYRKYIESRPTGGNDD